MIGVAYGFRWQGTWDHALVTRVPHAEYAWKCNESFWLLPHKAQNMCWGKPAPRGWDRVEG